MPWTPAPGSRPQHTGARVPSWTAQLLDVRDRGGQILMEIKGVHTKAEVATEIQTIRDTGMMDRVFVQSFEVAALQYTHELAPELPLGLLRSTVDADPVAICEQLHLTSYNPSDAAITSRPEIVADLHAAGVALMVWTPDSPQSWERLFSNGIDAIITNRPADWSAGTPGTERRQRRPSL